MMRSSYSLSIYPWLQYTVSIILDLYIINDIIIIIIIIDIFNNPSNVAAVEATAAAAAVLAVAVVSNYKIYMMGIERSSAS